jgi:hypothetical protein
VAAQIVSSHPNEVTPASGGDAPTASPLGGPQLLNYDESEDDALVGAHAPAYAFEVGDSCVVVLNATGPRISATVVGRIVGHTARLVQKYVVSTGDGKRSTFSADCIEKEDDDLEPENGATFNESGRQALELSGKIECFDVAKMSAHDIWHSILLKRNLSGGMLTRTILKDASIDSACQPLWRLSTVQEKKVEAKNLQGIDFISHFTPLHKLAWLRVKLFSTVSSNRNTYAKMHVTFNGHTTLSLATAGAPELTEELRCRIAHLALDAHAARYLAIIFGSRDNREKNDNKTLKETACWQDLTQQFVNSRLWQPHSVAADSHRSTKSIDTSVPPPEPGLDSTTVQDVFLDLRSDWTRLKTAVFSPTGCNSTGQELINAVWDNFIHGGRLRFKHPVTAMYVFISWLKAGTSLPELCNRTLLPEHQLSLGVGSAASEAFQTPQKTTPSSSTSTRKVSGKVTVDAIDRMTAMLQQFVSPSVQVRSTSPKIEERSDKGTKRSVFMEEPAADLMTYMTQNKIDKWWPQIYDKLGVTSIDELKFVGKNEIEKGLAQLPAYPRMKLLALIDVSESK